MGFYLLLSRKPSTNFLAMGWTRYSAVLKTTIILCFTLLDSVSFLHHAAPIFDLFCGERKCDYRVQCFWGTEAHCPVDAICVAAAAGTKSTERRATQDDWYADTGLGKLHLWNIQRTRCQDCDHEGCRTPSRLTDITYFSLKAHTSGEFVCSLTLFKFYFV